MKLTRLKVEQFRQFRHPVVLDSLESGINLITGPNESGKSTLVRAIRAAFFERFKSSSVDDLQPWGNSSAAPQVSLDFDWQDSRWRLVKTFVKQKRCDLQVGAESYSGEEAEDKIAELLGFQFAGRGASKAEHWGIPGLLWIEQGAGQDVQQSVQFAGDHLKSALGSTLGEVASSTGDGLIAQLDAERSQLLTGTGKPTGEYARVIKDGETLQNSLNALDQAIANYRQQVDRLAELRVQQQEDRGQPWLAFRRQAKEAEVRLVEVESWEQEQQREQFALTTCHSNQQLRREQLRAFSSQVEDLASRDEDKQQANANQEKLQEQQAQIQRQLEQAQTAYNLAREALRVARQQEQRSVAQRELDQLQKQMAESASKMSSASELQVLLKANRLTLEASQIDTDALKRLQKASRQLEDLIIAERAVATRVQFDLLPGKSLLLNDQPLTGQGEELLLESATLAIDGIGTLRILPGGEDLAELARRREALNDQISGLLASLRAESLPEAEERAESCRKMEEDILRHEGKLEALAPQGLEDLVEKQELAEQRQSTLVTQLEQLPGEQGDVLTQAVAEARLAAAEKLLKAAEKDEASYRSESQLAGQAVVNTTQEWQKLHQVIHATERQQQEQQAKDQLYDLQTEQGRLEKSLAARQDQIDAARPEILRQDIERFTRTANALESDAGKRALELERVQSSLEALGAQGLEEERAEKGLEFERQSQRRHQLERRATALDLLLQLLRDKRQALTRRLQEPLQRHINHYLQLLFPQASLTVDDDLIPRELVRTTNGSEERGDFEALSFGAREQMGLISRLAYADLLKEAGRPTLIILDDALVHSDKERLVQMKRILFDAAQRHQILLFTCHPENWRDLGVAPRDIQALKVSSQA